MPPSGAPEWHELGGVAELATRPLRQIAIGRTKIALSHRDGTFGAVSGVCNHVGGPLGEGHCDDAGYIVCPWHNWKFHRIT
ncbi:MAG TPA: Rieske 2Fe-2S domain-containing protein, partial [Candidatus Polarisedimenticolaceae bacterium]|nr:Rieske 2Fe-2S domain-containing protein [Candidatus Polarisedimenticolaceae bacterium]